MIPRIEGLYHSYCFTRSEFNIKLVIINFFRFFNTPLDFHFEFKPDSQPLKQANNHRSKPLPFRKIINHHAVFCYIFTYKNRGNEIWHNSHNPAMHIIYILYKKHKITACHFKDFLIIPIPNVRNPKFSYIF